MDGGSLGCLGSWVFSPFAPGPALQPHHVGRPGGIGHAAEELVKGLYADADAHDGDGNPDECVATRCQNSRINQGNS